MTCLCLERSERNGKNHEHKRKTGVARQNSIELKIAGKEKYKQGATRFGGQPDVPPDFVWPTYEGESYDHVVKDRPSPSWPSSTVRSWPSLTRNIFCPVTACSPSSMRRIPSAGAMTPRIRAVPASTGSRTYPRCPLLISRRIWRKTSNFLWSKSRWTQNTPIFHEDDGSLTESYGLMFE